MIHLLEMESFNLLNAFRRIFKDLRRTKTINDRDGYKMPRTPERGYKESLSLFQGLTECC